MDLSLTARVPAVEKLLDYAASGVGSVAGPMLASWRARREADARRISALGEADSLKIIAQAQSVAREVLVAPASSVQGEISIAETVSQRIQFQEEKRQRNIGAVVGMAYQELEDEDAPAQEPDHDWTARFFSDVQDISSEEMQILWAKVLTGEVKNPGSTSLKSLNILKTLDQSTAQLFRDLCSVCVTLRVDENSILDVRAPSLGKNAASNALREYKLGFGPLNVLHEHGLIISDYNSWRDYKLCIGSPTPGSQAIVIPFAFQKRFWTLARRGNFKDEKEFRLSGVSLTQSGKELSRIVDLEPREDYAEALMSFLDKSGLRMTEVDSWRPRLVSVDVRA